MVESDHKPLETIVKKPLANAPPRLQHMLLRLQKYNFVIQYKPGTQIYISDMLSRAYVHENQDEQLEEEIQCHVHLVVKNLPYSDEKLEDIKLATKNDSTLTSVIVQVHRGWPEHKREIPIEIREYWTHRDELSINEGLFMKGTQIVIPRVLRKDMLVKLHESHFGVEKTRNLAKDIMYWPGMSAQIENYVSKCGICLENRSSYQKESIIPSTISELPWKKQERKNIWKLNFPRF